MKLSALVGVTAVLVGTASFAADTLKINAMWATSSPGIPAGLKIACVSDAKALTPARTCPIIRYQGMTTWIYGFEDGRASLALVSYDGDGKVVRNVEHQGPRYLVSIAGDQQAQTVTITGEEGKTITVPRSELGK